MAYVAMSDAIAGLHRGRRPGRGDGLGQAFQVLGPPQLGELGEPGLGSGAGGCVVDRFDQRNLKIGLSRRPRRHIQHPVKHLAEEVASVTRDPRSGSARPSATRALW